MRRRVVEISPEGLGASPSPMPTDRALEELAATERGVTDRALLVPLFLDHAEQIAHGTRDDAVELALRKATRAHVVAKELGDEALALDALRARVMFAKRAQGRHALARELALELVGSLEAASEDTRHERALLLAEARSAPWYAERPPGSERAEDERNLRSALALLLDIGDEVADDTGYVAVQLVRLLDHAGDVAAAAEIRSLLRTSSSPVRTACSHHGLDL